MKNPHFFKAKSRLGLINPPMRHEEQNIGVEDAPDYILSNSFLDKFSEREVSEFNFTKPESVKKEEYYPILAKELREFTETIYSNLKPNQTQVVIGGDNSVTFSSLLAVIKRTPDVKTIGYLQFDSHGEMHLYESSISKNFHGMYMRPLLDKFDIPEIDSLAPKKLDLNQVLTIGNVIFDEGDAHPRGEPEFYKKISNIKREDYLNRTFETLSIVQNFISKYEHIHINFDIDIFTAESVGPSGMGNEGVWFWEDTLPIIKLLNKKPHISLDIVEVNPRIPGAEKTIKTAQEIISLMLN